MSLEGPKLGDINKYIKGWYEDWQEISNSNDKILSLRKIKNKITNALEKMKMSD